MLLRSSSSPALGSLVPSDIKGGGISNHHHHHQRQPLCCSTSPFSSNSSGVRRTRSDGNLIAAAAPSPAPSAHRRPFIRTSTRRHESNPGKPPSFFIYGGTTTGDAEVPDPEDDQADRDREEEEERRDSFGEPLKAFISWGRRKDQAKAAAANPPLFLARGLGIDRVGSGLLTAGGDYDGGDGSCCVRKGFGFGGEGEKSEMEMYYRKMVDEDPNNAMLLRNYAEFLYEVKGTCRGRRSTSRGRCWWIQATERSCRGTRSWCGSATGTKRGLQPTSGEPCKPHHETVMFLLPTLDSCGLWRMTMMAAARWREEHGSSAAPEEL